MNGFTFALLILVSLGLFGTVLVYVPRRLSSLFGWQHRKPAYIVTGLMAISYFSTMALVAKTNSSIMDIFYVVAALGAGVFLYLIVYLLGYELIRPVLNPPKRMSGMVVVSLAVLTTAFSFWNAYNLQVVPVTIPVKGLQKEVKVALLADIHLGAHRGGQNLASIVKATNALKPDLVMMPGDFADNNSALKQKHFAPLKKLKAPSYFVTGNHDTYINLKRVLSLLRKNGIKVLENQVVQTHGLQMVGLDYMKADDKVYDMHPSKDKRTIEKTMKKLVMKKGVPTILMHHSPVGLEYMKQRGVQVVLAGHTHGGGQVLPITLIGRIAFQYLAGLYQYKDMAVYVSEGIGTFGFPMRLGTKSELTLVRLVPKK